MRVDSSLVGDRAGQIHSEAPLLCSVIIEADARSEAPLRAHGFKISSIRLVEDRLAQSKY
jgi:hypothetical protein